MVSVIGAGAWGSAIYSAIEVEKCITSRTFRDIEGFVTFEEALKSEYLIIVIASQHIREFLKKYNLKNRKILVASKGIEAVSLKFLDEVFEEFEVENVAFLSGPSFAKEVKEKKPTALVIASRNEELAKEFASFFPEFIKIYLSSDVRGVEVAGAYKNVIAIAAGICEGLNLGENAKAALISRGLVEMERFATHFGAETETFLGVAGAGDLFLTANSTQSRNFRVGLNLAKGKKLDDILEILGEVAEGVYTTKAIYELSKANLIYTPIAAEVYQILYEAKKPHTSLRDLLS